MKRPFSSCPRCGDSSFVKAGVVGGRQRYRCKGCNFHFSVGSRGASGNVKRLAIYLYLEGMGYRAIGRILGVSDVAVGSWIGPMKEGLEDLRKKRIQVKEIHKLEHFFITKELFNKFGWLLIGMEENADICLLGSYTAGNCRIVEKPEKI